MKLIPLGSKVVITVGAIKGKIVAHAVYQKQQTTYCIQTGDGSQWWLESNQFAVKTLATKRKTKKRKAYKKRAKKTTKRTAKKRAYRKRRKPRAKKKAAERKTAKPARIKQIVDEMKAAVKATKK